MATEIKLNEQALDERLSRLEQARQWSPRVISRLETAIRTADDYDLFRINPLRYAAEKGMSESEAIDLFLYGVKAGLFEMEWHLVCMSCGEVVDNFRTMDRLHSHMVCSFCSSESEASLDDSIQVAFTLSSQVRDLVYLHPERLSAPDFFLRYGLSKGILPLPDGTSFYDFMESLAALMAYVEPGTTLTAEFDAPPGVMFGSDQINKTRLLIIFDEQPAPEVQVLRIRLIDGRLSGVDPMLVPQRMDFGGKFYDVPNAAHVPSGRVRVEMENQMPTRGSMWLMPLPMQLFLAKPPNQYEPFLTGKRLLSTQTFRDLFRSETVQTEEGIGVRDITIMFTDLKGSTALYDQIGDAKAYYLVRQHFDTLGRVVNRCSGAIVKTIGDAVMATFVNPADAVQASIEMLKEIDQFNAGISETLILKIGIHRGHSIVVTLNDRLDYFGQTVNIASRIQNLAGASEIYISDSVFESDRVAGLLGETISVRPEEAMLRGVGEKMQVYRLTTTAAEAARN